MKKLTVGTRGSALALTQTNMMVERLKRLNPDLHIDLKIIKTTGDKIIDVPLAGIGDKGLFVKELENALLAKEIDFAVHSMKDLPSEMPAGLCIAAVPERVDPSDVLISNGPTLADLPTGSRIGTGSVRRQAQLQHHRPDLKFLDIRGNLDTRLRKLDEGEFDAIILAYAGLCRMGWDDRITENIPCDICLPAIGQGALAIQSREGDEEVLSILNLLDNADTRTAVSAERSLMQALGGGCQVPLGGLATIKDGLLTLKGVLASPDGNLVSAEVTGPPETAEALGSDLASILRKE